MKTPKLIILFTLSLLLLSCDKKKQKEKEKPPVEINLSQEEAIEKLQYYVQTKSKTVMVQTHYYEWESKRIKCTQHDVDLNRKCSQPTATAPYGYRYEKKRVRKCCKYKPKKIFGTDGTWKATHSMQDDKWSVTFEFDNGLAKNTLNWILDDKSSKITDNNDYSKEN